MSNEAQLVFKPFKKRSMLDRITPEDVRALNDEESTQKKIKRATEFIEKGRAVHFLSTLIT